MECVSKIKHILSVIHNAICGAVCFQFAHFSCDDWENIYIYIYILCLIIIIKSEIWTITHCLGLSHETMVSVVCLSIFSSSQHNRLCIATGFCSPKEVKITIRPTPQWMRYWLQILKFTCLNREVCVLSKMKMWCLHTNNILVKLTWTFPGVQLKINGVPGNI